MLAAWSTPSICLPDRPPACPPSAAARLSAPLKPSAPAPLQTSRWNAQLARVGLDALRAVRCPLFECAAPLDQQLAALRQRCGGDGSGGAASNLPTVAQLQVTWAALVVALASAWVHHKLPQAELSALYEQAARDLLALQPDNPRSSFVMADAAVSSTPPGSGSRLRDPLPHYRRGAELARAQGSDFWLARWAGVGASCA